MTDLGLCPCGKQIFAFDGDFTGVVHDQPTCEEFELLGPNEFLTYVRRSRGITDEEVYKF